MRQRKLYTRVEPMPDAIWIDRAEELPAVAAALERQPWIGVDTEFLRERTFFPKLCVLQIAAGDRIWCIDALRRGSLEALVPALTAPASRKVIHAARQDLEAFYLNSKRIISPVFDTQIAAGCIGLKPQIGYAELANLLVGVTLAKGQTRTDWSKRPLSRAQLEYAADDVLHLSEIAARLTLRLRELGREHWVLEDCLALENPALYEPDPQRAWERLRGLEQLAPGPRSRAKALAVWREKWARDRDLPRSWILPDGAIFEVSQKNPTTPEALRRFRGVPAGFDARLAGSLIEALRAESLEELNDLQPGREMRPTAAQKSLIERLCKIVDARAVYLGVGAEILATRGELKALALGERNTASMSGWRREEVGESLLAELDRAGA